MLQKHPMTETEQTPIPSTMKVYQPLRSKLLSLPLLLKTWSSMTSTAAAGLESETLIDRKELKSRKACYSSNYRVFVQEHCSCIVFNTAMKVYTICTQCTEKYCKVRYIMQYNVFSGIFVKFTTLRDMHAWDFLRFPYLHLKYARYLSLEHPVNEILS